MLPVRYLYPTVMNGAFTILRIYFDREIKLCGTVTGTGTCTTVNYCRSSYSMDFFPNDSYTYYVSMYQYCTLGYFFFFFLNKID